MRYVESYIHANKIGVLVELEVGGGLTVATQEIKELASDLAMQIAASNPVGIDADHMKNDLPINFRHIEFQDYETPLLQQEYIKDTEIKVKQRIESTSLILKVPIKVHRFVRFSVDDT